MSMRELDRLKTLQALAHRMTSVSQAARHLGLSVRQLQRLRLDARLDVVSAGCPRTREGPRRVRLRISAIVDDCFRLIVDG